MDTIRSVCDEKGIYAPSDLRKDELLDVCCSDIKLMLMPEFRGTVLKVMGHDDIAFTRDVFRKKKISNYMKCERLKWGKGQKRGIFGGWGTLKGHDCKILRCEGDECEKDLEEYDKVKIRGFQRGRSFNLDRPTKDKKRILKLIELY